VQLTNELETFIETQCRMMGLSGGEEFRR